MNVSYLRTNLRNSLEASGVSPTQFSLFCGKKNPAPLFGFLKNKGKPQKRTLSWIEQGMKEKGWLREAGQQIDPPFIIKPVSEEGPTVQEAIEKLKKDSEDKNLALFRTIHAVMDQKDLPEEERVKTLTSYLDLR